jgi:hypothetical protein
MFWPLLIIGAALAFIGHLWIAMEAWQKGILWGLGCLFVPLVALIYVVLHWKAVKIPFLLQVAGMIAITWAQSLRGVT